MAKDSTDKLINGLIILDKPIGMTSNRCLQKVKHLLGAHKAGHTGSLDPLATGVLPLCFGEATKVSQFLLESDKTYSATIKLGIATDTGDSEGAVVSNSEVPDFDLATIDQTLQSFTGLIDQVASIYSALKQNGVPLYKLARAGKKIEPKSRKITIYYIKLLSWSSPNIEVEVSCSKGTYIRSLAEDIGAKLGTGAHITALRRLKAGPFNLEQSHTLESLQEMQQKDDGASLKNCLLVIDEAIADIPLLNLNQEQTLRLRQGQLVQLNQPLTAGQFRIYFEGEFIGLAELRDDGNLAAKRLMQY
ncbi:MAG: tRNA pseudouridine(55) synthase TruB [Pseudomonadota bacterium]